MTTQINPPSASQYSQLWKSTWGQSLSDILQNNSLRIFLPPKSVLILNAKDNVGSLLQQLRENSLRCAVVYDTEKLFIGFVDTFDIAIHVLNVTNWPSTIEEETFKNLDMQAFQFICKSSGELTNISGTDRFQSVTPDTLLKDALSLLSAGQYRLAVVEDGAIVNIVSQWDILLLMSTRLSFLDPKFEKSVQEAGLGTNRIFTYPQDGNVVKLLQLLGEKNISGVPLVDENGRLCFNFSTTDLLNLTLTNFPLLTLGARDFLFRTYGFLKPPICVKKNHSLEIVILKFICYRIHRVYIVNDEMEPIGVITLTDLMNYLLFESYEFSPSQ